MALGALLGRGAATEGEEVLEAVHAQRAHALHEPMQHRHGGLGIVEGPMAGGSGGPEVARESLQLAVAYVVAGEGATGDAGGVDHAGCRPRQVGLVARSAQEGHVIGRVVRHQHCSARELPKSRDRCGDRGRSGKHPIGDPGQGSDEGRDGHARIGEGLVLTDHLAAAHLDRADLGDARIHGLAAGGLEIDDDEGDIAQGRAEVVEG